MKNGVVAVIPARLESSRFPGKVAHLYRERPLLFYVWRQVRKARTVARTVIATDSRQVEELGKSFGAEVVRTSARHQTGSDRLVEVMDRIPASIYINVQADVFGPIGGVLDRVIRWMQQHRQEKFATIARPLDRPEDLDNPDKVKVVGSADGYALWFSRSPLPYVRSSSSSGGTTAYRHLYHIGAYVFRAPGLRAFGSWKRSPAEKAESLEQLRILEHDARIKLFSTKARLATIDSPRDVNVLDHIEE